MTLIDFTLSNARRFYSSMGNPLAVKGLNIPGLTFLPLHRPLNIVACAVQQMLSPLKSNIKDIQQIIIFITFKSAALNF